MTKCKLQGLPFWNLFFFECLNSALFANVCNNRIVYWIMCENFWLLNNTTIVDDFNCPPAKSILNRNTILMGKTVNNIVSNSWNKKIDLNVKWCATHINIWTQKYINIHHFNHNISWEIFTRILVGFTAEFFIVLKYVLKVFS